MQTLKAGFLSFLVVPVSFFLFCKISLAVPAAPDPFIVYQPDGTSIEVYTRGDEYQNWIETGKGYSIGRDKKSKKWFYIDHFKGKTPVLNGVPADKEPPGQLKKHIKPPREKDREGSSTDTSASAGISASLSGAGSLQPAPAFGSPTTMSGKILFILVEFTDRTGTYPAGDWAGFLSNKIADFYNAASYGAANLGPAQESDGTYDDGVVGWVNLGYAYPFNDSETMGISYANRQKIITDAINAADSNVNYASYDVNSDGYVDADELAVTVILAGYERAIAGAYTPNVWGHKSSLEFPVTVDGVTVGDSHSGTGGYAMFGEIHQSNPTNMHQATMGIQVHELGHLIFGFPDLYDTDYTSSGIGSFCVMSGGSWGRSSGDTYSGETPVLPSASIRYHAGWVVASSVCGEKSITAAGDTSAGVNNTVFRVKTDNYPNDTEYFLVENRQPLGYDRGLERWFGTAFGGLAIFHIDDTMTVNTDDTHRWVDLEEADGIQMGTGGGSGAKLWFDGQSTNTSGFSATSTPSSALYDATSSGVSVTNISVSDTVMTATLAADTGNCLPDGSLLYEDFDREIPPPGWSIVDNEGYGKVWAYNNPSNWSNQTGGSGNFAVADSNYYYFIRNNPGDQSGNMNTELRSPFFNPSGYNPLYLSFKSYYYTANTDYAHVDIRCSADSWQWHNVWAKDGVFSGVTDAPLLDITALTAGSTGCQLRFHYYSGLVYFWQIDDIEVGGPLSQSGYDGSSYSLPANQWRLIGLPRDPGGENTIRDLFGDDLPENEYDVSWAVFGRNKTLNVNEELALDSALNKGDGYWVKSYQAASLDIPGTPTAPTFSGDCPDGCYEIPLYKGESGGTYRYNMLGHPFSRSVDWADLRFRVVNNSENTTLYSLLGASTNDYISNIGYTYNGSAYQAFDGVTPGNEGTLNEFDGFFLKVLGGSIVNTYQTITLLVPAADMTSPAPSDSMNKKNIPAGKKEAWYIRLTVTDTANGLKDPGNVLGQLPDSVLGYDLHDLKELSPPKGGDYLTIVFPHPDWNDMQGNYTSDFHALPEKKGRKFGKDAWQFEVRTNDPQRSVTLSWEGPAEILKQSALVDNATGQVVQVGDFGSYAFTMNDTVRRFRWEKRK